MPPGYMQEAGSIGDAYGQGIRGAAQSIAQALIDREEEVKNEAKAAKAAETFMEVLGDKAPIPLAEFKNLSAKQKTAAVTGIMQAEGYQRGVQAAQLNAEQIKSMQAAQKRAELSNQRLDAFQQAMAERTKLPNGQIGPTPAVGPDEMLGIMSSTGVLFDPTADNVLNAMARFHHPDQVSRAGTVAPLPNGDNFVWLSDKSGQVVPSKSGGQADAPPEGYTVWDDGSGKPPRLVRKAEVPLGMAERMIVSRLPQDKQELEQLLALQRGGTKKVEAGVGNDGLVKPYDCYFFGGEDIQMRINSVTDRIRRAESIMSTARSVSNPQPQAPAPATKAEPGSFDDYLNWKRGNNGK